MPGHTPPTLAERHLGASPELQALSASAQPLLDNRDTKVRAEVHKLVTGVTGRPNATDDQIVAAQSVQDAVHDTPHLPAGSRTAVPGAAPLDYDRVRRVVEEAIQNTIGTRLDALEAAVFNLQTSVNALETAFSNREKKTDLTHGDQAISCLRRYNAMQQ